MIMFLGGEMEGVNDLVAFESATVQELKDSFCYMVDEHIKVLCGEEYSC